MKGKLCYFGKWADDPEGEQALRLWSDQKDDLLAGKPQPQLTRKGTGGGITIKRVVNDFLNAKRRLLDTGEITSRTFGEYHAVGFKLADVFGPQRDVVSLTASDFGHLREKLAKNCGPVRLGNEITRARMYFRFAYDEGLIDQPVRYGQSFNKPSAKVIRKARAANGSRMFEADELRRILDALHGKPVDVKGQDEPVTLSPDPALRAMTLLAINCGYGAADVAALPQSVIDGDWITFPRPKTGIERRAKLWMETADAISEYMVVRPDPKNDADAGLVFINSRGQRWLRHSPSDDPAKWDNRTDLVGKRFAKLLKRLDIIGRRGFYAIRHSFQTAAEESRDLPAVMHVMGHSDSSMSARYRERITDERLEAVADAVHAWLFAEWRLMKHSLRSQITYNRSTRLRRSGLESTQVRRWPAAFLLFPSDATTRTVACLQLSARLASARKAISQYLDAHQRIGNLLRLGPDTPFDNDGARMNPTAR